MTPAGPARGPHRSPSWRLIDTGLRPGPFNLALDEALFELAAAGGRAPTLRFYGWSPAAVSVGHFQKWREEIDEAACRRRGLEVLRRVTGGRAVLHGDEVTYSVVCTSRDAPLGDGLLPAYRSIARALATGLRRLGVDAETTSPLRKGEGRALARHPSCFAASAGHEIAAGGRKLVGSAQKRQGGALLQHGSILVSGHAEEFERILRPERRVGAMTAMTSLEELLGFRPSRDAVVEALAEGFREAWGVGLRRSDPTEEEMERAANVMEIRYMGEAR